jgi:hypothetical protein
MGDYNLTIKKGITQTLVCTYKAPSGSAINLTGYTVRSQGRLSIESQTPIFSFTIGDGVTVSAATGQITIKWPAAASETYPLAYGGVWSLEVQSGDGTVTELLSGQLDIVERPTRG